MSPAAPQVRPVASWMVDGAVPVTKLPWRPPAGPLARTRRLVTYIAALPMVAAAAGLDHAIQPFLERTEGGNAYRVLAQKL